MPGPEPITPRDELPPMPGKVKLIAAVYLLSTIIDAVNLGRFGSARSTFGRLVIELAIVLLLCTGSDRMRAVLRVLGVVGVLAGGMFVQHGATVGLAHEPGLVAFVYGLTIVLVSGYTVWALGSPDVRAWYRRARDLAQDEE
jgi:hypothetical protein